MSFLPEINRCPCCDTVNIVRIKIDTNGKANPFKNLKGYGKIRIYGFLAERFMSYWFKKNTKSITIPITFYDIRKNLNQNP